MKIILNGSTQELDINADKIALEDFLKQNQYQNEYIAIAINLNFIPKSNYSSCYINDGDNVEILTPMQGG